MEFLYEKYNNSNNNNTAIYNEWVSDHFLNAYIRTL